MDREGSPFGSPDLQLGPWLGIHMHIGKLVTSEDDFLCLKFF